MSYFSCIFVYLLVLSKYVIFCFYAFFMKIGYLHAPVLSFSKDRTFLIKIKFYTLTRVGRKSISVC